jgi:predicted Ser/Thr protein kinase
MSSKKEYVYKPSTDRCSRTGSKQSPECKDGPKNKNTCRKRKVPKKVTVKAIPKPKPTHKPTPKAKPKSKAKSKAKPNASPPIDLTSILSVESPPKVKPTKAKPKAKSKAKPVVKAAGGGGSKETGRQGLCPLPKDYIFDGRLGTTGKDGETWKVRHLKSGKLYACKIFDAKKPLKLIQKEISDQMKMSSSGVSPKVVWTHDRCILMEMINGPILLKYLKREYTQKDVKQFIEIANALAKAQIAYADGNVKMNVMFDTDYDRWMLIDFGMTYPDSRMKKEAKKAKISLEKYFLVNAYNILINIEVLLMNKIYGPKNMMYTPIGGGYIPKKSFPTLIHEIEKQGILHLIGRFEIGKSTRERYTKAKVYDKSKMIGMN